MLDRWNYSLLLQQIARENFVFLNCLVIVKRHNVCLFTKSWKLFAGSNKELWTFVTGADFVTEVESLYRLGVAISAIHATDMTTVWDLGEITTRATCQDLHIVLSFFITVKKPPEFCIWVLSLPLTWHNQFQWAFSDNEQRQTLNLKSRYMARKNKLLSKIDEYQHIILN